MTVPSSLMALGFAAAVSLTGTHAAHAESTADTTKTQQQAQTQQAQPVTVTVQPGDTLSSIATAHGTTYVRIFDANDSITNPDVIDVNQQFRIPTADEQLPDRYSQYEASLAPAPAPVAAAVTTPAPAPVRAAAPAPAPRAAAAAPTRATYTRPVASASNNTYAYGWCTWYVKSRKPNIPNNWGNAYSWISSARASGYATGSAPVPGAIGAAGDHVVYVESVSGSNVTISEMAYAGGVGVVHYRTVPASSFYYIYA